MSSIDADDEFAQGIIRHSELKLCALACQWRTFPLSPKRLIFQARAKRQGPLAHRLMALGRFNGQEFGQELRSLAIRQHAAQARRYLHEFGRGRSGQISPRTENAMEKWGKQCRQPIQRGFFTATVPNTVRILRLV